MHARGALGKTIDDTFSPIYISDDILKGGKAGALYKFFTFFFPSLGPPVLKLLLDMENHSRKVIAGISSRERDSLIKDLEGITVELKYAVRENGKEIAALPIKIHPAEVLRNAIAGKESSRYNKKMREEINNLIISFMKRQIEEQVKVKIEAVLRDILAKPKIPSILKNLLNLGFINKEGRLAEGTTITDLVSGKYAGLFKKVVAEEMINDALIIKDTLDAFYSLEENYEISANEILREKGILEITVGEMKK